jgi:dUTP pyrophosphatase
MNLHIKRIDTTLPLPHYQTSGSVAFDLYARTDMEIEPLLPTIIPTNLVIKVPKGYFLMLASRSSLQLKKNLLVANGIGVIDEDYHGDNDEIGVVVLNYTKNPVIIERGERIAQALLVKIGKVNTFIEKKSLAKKSRGGFGSTGNR